MPSSSGSVTIAPVFSAEDFQQREAAFPFWSLMFFTFVLFVGPQFIFPVLEPFRLAMVAGGLAIVAHVWSRLANGRSLTVNVAEVRLVLWLVFAAVLSIPFSYHPGGSLDALVRQFSKTLAAFFLLANMVDTVRRMKLMLGSLVLWGIIYAMTGLQNYSAGNLETSLRIPGYSSPLTTNANDLALTLNLILPFVIGFYLTTSNLFHRLSLLAIMGLMAGSVIVSFSRGGFLGLGTILVVLLVKWVRERGLVAIAPVFVFVPLIPFLLPQGYGDRLYSMYDFSYDPTGSATVRWELMRIALTLMLENPFMGAGFDMQGAAYHRVSGRYDGVHNVYLQIGVELGLPGLLIFLLLIVRMLKGFRLSLRQLRGLPDARTLYALGYGLEMSLLAFLVQALFFPVAYHYHFYYVAGLAVAFQGVTKRLLVQPQRVS